MCADPGITNLKLMASVVQAAALLPGRLPTAAISKGLRPTALIPILSAQEQRRQGNRTSNGELSLQLNGKNDEVAMPEAESDKADTPKALQIRRAEKTSRRAKTINPSDLRHNFINFNGGIKLGGHVDLLNIRCIRGARAKVGATGTIHPKLYRSFLKLNTESDQVAMLSGNGR